jgi:aminoglycoside phosphotransferase (APT) family kinase protein
VQDVARLRELAQMVLSDVDWRDAEVVVGEFHDVVIATGLAVVKVARGGAVHHLQRRADLLSVLGRLDLPFATPTPLAPVVRCGDRAAVALSWVHGGPPPHPPEAAALSGVLEALSSVDVAGLKGLLDAPHAYAGRERWECLMLNVVPDMLPDGLRVEAVRRVERALALPQVEPGLVHGDLAGTNLLWRADGTLSGVLDWDLAQAFDPAVDVGCLAWFGWDAVRAAVNTEQLHRARVWADTFPLEQVAAAVDNGEPEPVIQRVIDRVVAHLNA